VVHVLWKDKNPVRDVRGLILTPDTTLAEAPDLYLLVILGGNGQEAIMDDEEVLTPTHPEANGIRALCMRFVPES
jgi:cyclohexyl-isocyanide hydratase